MNLQSSAFWKLFQADTATVSLSSDIKKGVLQELVSLLVTAGKIGDGESKSLLKALVKRESVGSTGIGAGVAIPHVKHADVKETIAAVGVAKEPVDYDAVDGEACTLFFMVISPKEEAETHLEILRWLSKLVRDQDFTRFLRAAETPEEVSSLFEEMGG